MGRAGQGFARHIFISHTGHYDTMRRIARRPLSPSVRLCYGYAAVRHGGGRQSVLERARAVIGRALARSGCLVLMMRAGQGFYL